MDLKMRLWTLILIVGLAGCSREKPADSELAGIKAYAEAQVTIERLRKQTDPGWDAISSKYEITSKTVRQIDAAWGTVYDKQIRAVLKKCAAGEKVKVNQQILAKGLQHVTVLVVTGELDRMAESTQAERKVAAEHIAAYFEGIRPTLTRRDTDFFGRKKTLETSADTALGHLSEAGSAGLLAARREIEDVIARTYALSVLYEIMEIEKARDSDRDKCDVKRKEAEIFYRIIEPRVKRNNPKMHEIVSNTLAGSYDTMDAKAVEQYLITGLGLPALR
ncbi:MAG: hypothetical protein ACYTBJ_08525 [Planctomycetota bacterium]|jgi:hypothetical protein